MTISRPAPSYRALKKASKARKSVRRQWGTTLPQATSKKLKKVNVEAQAKRRARYRKKLAAYRKSECYKIVEARAGGRCEGMDTIVHHWSAKHPVLTPVKVKPYRCDADKHYEKYGHPVIRLTHHHKTYARFGGKELPEDIIVLCDRHNAEAESQHPTRRRNYRKSGVAAQGETRE